jgi:hypothetical protein
LLPCRYHFHVLGVASEVIAFIFPKPLVLTPGFLFYKLDIAVVLIESIGRWLQHLIIHSFSELFVTFGTIVSFAFLVEHSISDCLMSGAILFLHMGSLFTETLYLWAVTHYLVSKL